ncbi:MAG: sensor histidine kinase [Bacteroidota bacterium]
MKKISIILLLFPVFVMLSQEGNTEQINTLKAQITRAEGGEKLTLLDSLTRLTLYNLEYNYDSIVKVTIDLAIKEQNYNIAAAQTGDLIFYLVNRRRQFEEGLQLFKATLDRNWHITDSLSLATLYGSGADSFLESGFAEESIQYYETAERLYLKFKDSVAYGNIKGFKAYALSRIGEFAAASREYQKALSVFIKKEDYLNIIKLRIGLSILYSQNRFYEEAEKEYLVIDSLSIKVEDYGAHLANLGNMAYDYAAQGKYKKSIACHKRRLNVLEKYPELNFFEPLTYQELAVDYIATDSLENARLYIQKLKSLITNDPENYNLKDLYTKAETLLFLSEGELDKAEVSANKLLALREGISDYEFTMEVYEMLYKIYNAKNDEQKALKYLESFINIKDSIESVQKARALSYYQTLYETEKRDAKITSQNAEITILNTENRLNQQYMFFGGVGLLAVFLIIYLVRSRRFAQKRQELQAQFSQDLLKGQEEERSRLARELHDSVGQKLMLLSKTTKKLGNENAEQLASSTLEEVRSISRGLHPSNLERLGLTMAINALVYDINANTELFFTENIENVDNLLSKESELHVYRIIQESLSNIVKHAEAKAVKLDIQKEPTKVTLSINDNGKGFDITSKQKSISLGIKTLFERARIIDAYIDLQSTIGKGTKLTVSIPINHG